mmetsp:Transcript_5130/g.13240  ORF Transcript_5130/g.13240 Transcript_5130/m.13240 type:complete len:244 (-) Transcript_5130:429-1160(-)
MLRRTADHSVAWSRTSLRGSWNKSALAVLKSESGGRGGAGGGEASGDVRGGSGDAKRGSGSSSKPSFGNFSFPCASYISNALLRLCPPGCPSLWATASTAASSSRLTSGTAAAISGVQSAGRGCVCAGGASAGASARSASRSMWSGRVTGRFGTARSASEKLRARTRRRIVSRVRSGWASRRCVVRSAGAGKISRHCAHLGLWVSRACVLRCAGCLNEAEHSGHTCGLTSSWTAATCRLSSEA